MVRRTSFWRTIYLTRFSKPSFDRPLFRRILRQRMVKFVELGVGDGQRAKRMIEAAQRHATGSEIRYVGVDLFESRPEGWKGLTLKQAHQKLAHSGITLRLLPGDPFSTLARAANSLTGSDLIIIRANQDADSLQRAWFYLPRMLHQRSVVLREVHADGEPFLEEVSAAELALLARAA